MWVAHGRLEDALDWVRARSLSADDDLSYVREYEHITLARVLLARGGAEHSERPIHDATGLLERLLRAAEEGKRRGSVIEILVLQALVERTRGAGRAALSSLEQALTLAEREGYVRTFVDEGAPLADLLGAAARQGVASGYARRLLGAVDTPRDDGPAYDLIEPLSARELDVLRLLGTDLDGRDIARQLFVSLNTVRTHTKNIYAKLGVNSRRAAVRRAEELNLTSPPRARRPQGSGVQDR